MATSIKNSFISMNTMIFIVLLVILLSSTCRYFYCQILLDLVFPICDEIL